MKARKYAMQELPKTFTTKLKVTGDLAGKFTRESLTKKMLKSL
jgi:hypothetical protein